MKPEFLALLTELENVSCTKESTGDLTRITAIRRLTRNKGTIAAGSPVWAALLTGGVYFAAMMLGRRQPLG